MYYICLLYTSVRQLLALAPSEQADMEQKGWYLMAVIDVIDSMSREIFEHYKSLEERCV